MKTKLISKLIKLTLLVSLITSLAVTKELKIIGPWEISGLEPTQSGSTFSKSQVAETLTTIDDKGVLIPSLATKWKVSKNGLIWNFAIRQNVKFHDGTALTAKVIAFNLNRETTLKKSILRTLPIKTIQVKGQNLEIVLTEEFSALPAYFTHYSTIILSKKSFNDKGRVVKIIGTGAYKIKKITAPLRVKMTKNNSWWKGDANIKDISFLTVHKGETRTLMLKSGEADIGYSISPIALQSLSKNPKLNTTIVTIPRTTLLKVNSGSEFLNNSTLRKAISLAIDRKNISKAVLKNDNLAAEQMLPASIKNWHNPNLTPLKKNVKEAQALLEKEGWILKDDGFRYKQDKKFKITLDSYPNRSELPVISTAIQAQLKEVGIDVEVLIGNYTEIIRKHKDNTLHLGLISRNFALVPNPLGTLLQDYGRGGANWGAMNWENPTMFQALDKLKKGKNQKLQNKIIQLLQEELPSIPITWSELVVVNNKRITNLKVDPFELSYFLSDVKWSK